MNENEQEQQLSGPDVLNAFVYGDGIPALEMAALDQARELYGPDAALQIEQVATIQTSLNPQKGKFCTRVQVRCLNLPDEDR